MFMAAIDPVPTELFSPISANTITHMAVRFPVKLLANGIAIRTGVQRVIPII
jgi:hypothetical protein